MTEMRIKRNGKTETIEYSKDNMTEWENLTTNEFMSVEEIATDVLEKMDDKTKEYVKNTPRKDLIQFHFGTGMAIRNQYGLWHPKNPFVIPGDLGDGHPDGLSMLVINSIHKQLQ